MGIFSPALGEVIDRSIILELKLSRASKAVSENVKVAWEEELLACQNFVNEKQINPFHLIMQLKILHAKLWDEENLVRGYVRESNYYWAGLCAARITALNQRRSIIVGDLNAVDGKAADVKVYGNKISMPLDSHLNRAE